jgi:hypothetical protein
MTSDPRVAVYRQKVFVDILFLPDLRKQMSELFEKIEFIRNFTGSHIETGEKPGFWHLMHRFDEVNDYIKGISKNSFG